MCTLKGFIDISLDINFATDALTNFSFYVRQQLPLGKEKVKNLHENLFYGFQEVHSETCWRFLWTQPTKLT